MARRDRRRQIMQAAAELFTTGRFHEVTTDDIARQARVGKGTIYRYFRDKDDLFFQTAHSGFEELCEVLRRKVPSRGPFARQLVGACVQVSRFFQRRRQMFRMVQIEDNRMSFLKGRLLERWKEKRRALVQAMAEIIRKGVAEGQVRRDMPPEVLASFLLGMLRTRAHDLRDAPASAPGYELLVDLFQNGAAPRRRRPANRPERSGPPDRRGPKPRRPAGRGRQVPEGGLL